MNAIAQQFMKEAVQRIIGVASPLRIIVFGSAARGDEKPGSDLDLLIVVKNGISRRQTAQLLYKAMIGLGCATDLVVVTQEDVERFGQSPATVLAPALREGKVLYAA